MGIGGGKSGILSFLFVWGGNWPPGSEERGFRIKIDFGIFQEGIRIWQRSIYHQEFQVPKMEGFLNLIFGYFGVGFSRIHKPYIHKCVFMCEDSSILGT